MMDLRSKWFPSTNARGDSPRRRTETLDQKIEKNFDFESSLPTWRHHGPQWKLFRLMRILQQRFQKPFLDCAGHGNFAQTHDTRPFDCQSQQVRAIGADRASNIDRDQ